MTDQSLEPQISGDQDRTLRQTHCKLVGLPELRLIEPPASGKSRTHLVVTIDVEYFSIEGLQEIQRSLGAAVRSWCEERTWPVAWSSLRQKGCNPAGSETLETGEQSPESGANTEPIQGSYTAEGLRVG